jgi:hypothetical protein
MAKIGKRPRSGLLLNFVRLLQQLRQTWSGQISQGCQSGQMDLKMKTRRQFSGSVRRTIAGWGLKRMLRLAELRMSPVLELASGIDNSLFQRAILAESFDAGRVFARVVPIPERLTGIRPLCGRLPSPAPTREERQPLRSVERCASLPPVSDVTRLGRRSALCPAAPLARMMNSNQRLTPEVFSRGLCVPLGAHDASSSRVCYSFFVE